MDVNRTEAEEEEEEKEEGSPGRTPFASPASPASPAFPMDTPSDSRDSSPGYKGYSQHDSQQAIVMQQSGCEDTNPLKDLTVRRVEEEMMTPDTNDEPEAQLQSVVSTSVSTTDSGVGDNEEVVVDAVAAEGSVVRILDSAKEKTPLSSSPASPAAPSTFQTSHNNFDPIDDNNASSTADDRVGAAGFFEPLPAELSTDGSGESVAVVNCALIEVIEQLVSAVEVCK